MQVIIFLKKYRYYVVALLFIILFIVVINMFGSKDEDSEYADGYTKVKTVPGIQFDVQRSYADTAQAVLEISNKVKFHDYQTYSYKNGKDTYMLFNINNTIVIARKGTAFDLANGTSMLEKKTLNGIWFTPQSSVTKKDDKCYVDVSAEVIITNDMFNDFNGRLCTISDEETEYSLFIGSSDKDVIDHICESLSLCNDNQIDTNTYIIDMDTDVVTKVESSESSEEIILPETTESPAPEETEIVEITIPDEQDVPKPIEPEEEEPEQTEENLMAENNQQDIEKEEGKAYSSTIYSMLNVGDTGYAKIKNGSSQYETAYVKAIRILGSEETTAAIYKYIASGESYYESFEIPKGTHLEAVEYDVKYESKTAYLNLLLKGVDGETLKYNGIERQSRTYDIPSKKEKDGWSVGNISFYVVPNGCTEYVLQFGEGVTSNEEKCFYHVQN